MSSSTFYNTEVFAARINLVGLGLINLDFYNQIQ